MSFDRPRSARSPFAAKKRVAIGVSALLVLAAGFLPGTSAVAAGTPLLSDDFADNAVSSPEYNVGGSFTPCLTVPGGTTGVPTSCEVGATDAEGSGALRLTSADDNLAGYLLYDRALPTKGGLDISFTQYQWGGNGADGISFFLTDGEYDLNQAGPSGGSLGYNAKNSTTNGLAHALLGVGLDAYGNFAREYNAAGCAITSPAAPDAISVRGPAGDTTSTTGSTSGYCLLGAPTPISGGIDNAGATNRLDGVAHSVRIVIDPPVNALPKVTVYWDGAQVVQVPQPAILKSTPTFKFGWAASTGGSTNNHEINYLTVASVNELLPELEIASPATIATANAGSESEVTFTPSVSAAGGPESAAVVFTATLPTGVSFADTPSGTDWLCAAPAENALTATCTYTPSASMMPGTVLPTISVPVTTTASGTFAIAGSIDSADNSLEPASTTTDAPFAPVVSAASGSGVAHGTAPATVSIEPSTPVGTAPFGFTLSSTPDPAEGSATIDAATGEISFVPADATSGTSLFGYQATSAGITSDPATVTISINPATAGAATTTEAGEPVDVDLADLSVGTGLGYSITQPAPAHGSVAVTAAGLATFTPTDGFSGTTSFTYTATDDDSLSGTATIGLTVIPTVTGLSATGTLDEDGAASVETGAATTDGSGPFTFDIVTAPSQGTATIDESTGAISYVAATGTSGSFTVGFTATDVNSGTSTEQTASIVIRPFAAGISGETLVNEAVTLSAPEAVGVAPFEWAVTTAPGDGTVTIDSETGVVTFTPDEDWSGIDTVGLTATDSNGLAADEVIATVRVRPVANDATGSTVASATPSAITIPITSTGTAPWTYDIVSELPAALGTAAFTADGDLIITPADSVSGTLRLTYRATDADGLGSDAATVTLTVVPLAADAALTLTSGDTGRLALPTPIARGPLAWTIESALPASAGTASVDAATGEITVLSSADHSGTATLTYSVTDVDGVSSVPRTVTVNIRPGSGAPAGSTVLASVAGENPTVVLSAATPTGSGPFEFQIVTPPMAAQGIAVIGPDTGELAYTAAADYSGIVTIAYSVTDANGATVHGSYDITVMPRAAGIARGEHTGTEGRTQVYTPPTPVGVAPFSYRLTQLPAAEHGTASIDSTSGVITFTPAPGFTGFAGIRYAVTDAHGLESAPTEVVFEVQKASAPPTLSMTGADPVPIASLGVLLAGLGVVLLSGKALRARSKRSA